MAKLSIATGILGGMTAMLSACVAQDSAANTLPQAGAANIGQATELPQGGHSPEDSSGTDPSQTGSTPSPTGTLRERHIRWEGPLWSGDPQITNSGSLSIDIEPSSAASDAAQVWFTMSLRSEHAATGVVRELLVIPLQQATIEAFDPEIFIVRAPDSSAVFVEPGSAVVSELPPAMLSEVDSITAGITCQPMAYSEVP